MRGGGKRNRDGLDYFVRNDFTGHANGPVVQTGSIHGNVHLNSPRHRYDLRPFTIPSLPDPAELRRQPSQLLLASNQVVPFTGRENELARLGDWLRGPGRISAQLVHGPGGHGKTRLAAEFAAEATRAGYTVLVAHHVGDSAITGHDHELSSHTPSGLGVLVVVDYAERWPRSDLLALFEDSRIRHAGPTRVLLLARSGSRWWDLLRYPLHKLGVATAAERLTELAAGVPARRAVFESARDSFAAVLRTDAGGVGPAGSFTDNAYRSVLTILMAALAAVDACDHNRMPPAHPGALASYLLDREADHWTLMRAGGTVESPTNVLARVVFVATLTGPMSYQEGCDVLRVAGLAACDEQASRLLDDHQACYPPMDDGVVLTPLAPDRMGEDLVARYLPGGEGTGDPRTPELMSKVLSAPVPALRRAQLITVLAEASKRWPHVAEHLATLVREDPHRVITAGGGALMAVVDTAGPGLLAAIEPRLPDRHVDLDFPAARLTQRLTELRLAYTRHPAERARLWTTLGRRLANAGAFDEALKASEPAVDIYEGLVARHPGRFEADLAEALHHLGTHLSGAGFSVRALNATGKAVAIRQRLAKSNPAEHEPDLASSLHNQGMDLSCLGMRDAALRATQEAVSILRRLPAEHEPGLAAALNNLGMHLADVGRHREALEVARHSTCLHRRLAADNPKVFEPDLAGSLHNLGQHSSQLGRWADALLAIEEAVAIRRRLAITNPAMFEPELALSLRELAAICLELGRYPEALGRIGHAVDLHRNLAVVNPAVYQAELATSLHNQGVHLARVGEHGQAVVCARQAVTIRAAIFEANLHTYELQLNDMLTQLGVSPPGTPRENPPPDDALDLQRSVNIIFRSSAHSSAQSTDNLGARSTTAHRLTAAIAATHPRWADHLKPAAAKLVALEAQLARTLSNVSSRHIALGRQVEALTAAEQAAATYQRLAELDLGHRADYASALANLGARLAEFGRRDQALAATRWAVETIGGAAATDRTPQVAGCLQAFAWVRMLTGLELDHAMRAAEASVRIYRELGPVFARDLRLALTTCSDLLRQVGRVHESLAIKRELRAPTGELFLRTPQLAELTAHRADLVARTP